MYDYLAENCPEALSPYNNNIAETIAMLTSMGFGSCLENAPPFVTVEELYAYLEQTCSGLTWGVEDELAALTNMGFGDCLVDAPAFSNINDIYTYLSTNCPAYINNNMPDCALFPPDGLTYQQYLQYVNASCPNQISVPECYLTAPIFATDEEFMAWITANCNGMAPDNTPQTEALRIMYSMNAAQTNQSVTGINNLPTTTIKVSPNPTNAWLNINSPTPITQYTLYDLTGRKVLTDNNLNTQQTRINLSTLPNGLYVLQLTDANQQTSQQKVVLEK